MGTWQNVIATGVGGDGVEFRLVVEGAPFEFVTCEEMSGACTESGQLGVRRVNGLLRESVGFTESAYLAGAKIDIGLSPLRIVETPGADLDAATSMFTPIPQPQAWLATTLGPDPFTDTTAVLNSTVGLAEDEYLHLDTEVVRIASISDSTTAIVERAQWRTTAQRHPVEATDGTPRIRALRDFPSTWIGRRIWVYAHGADELDVGDTGTLIFRGVILNDPQLEGGEATTWIINIDSRWSILAQELGAELDVKRQVAGVYYPGAYAYTIWVRRSLSDLSADAYEGDVKIQICGFYRTNKDFCEALCAALNADPTIAGWGFVFSYTADASAWQLNVRVPSPARYPKLFGGGPVDGYFNGRVGELVDPLGAGRILVALDSVAANQTYTVLWGDDMSVAAFTLPAGLFGEIAWGFAGWRPPFVPLADMRREPRTINAPSTGWAHSSAADVASFPTTRVHLNSVSGLTANATLLISELGAAEDVPARAFQIDTVDPSTGGVVCEGVRPLGLLVAGTQSQTIAAAIKYPAASEGTTFAGFRDELVAAAPEVANVGGAPFVLDDDLADWTAVVDEIVNIQPHLYGERQYAFREGVRLDDVLEHEAMLHGVFFYLDADFKIALRPLTIDTQPVPDSHVLSNAGGTLLDVDGFGQLTSGSDGNVNVVEFKLGYDPIEGKHTRGSIRVRNVEGMSEARKERVLEIAPLSSFYVAGERLTTERAMQIANPVLTLFGGAIRHYSFPVSLRHFNVLVGDSVLISSDAMPYNGARAVNDPTGLRGMRGARAIVVGRDWSEIASCVGRLTVLITGVDLPTYAPSGSVNSASGSGTSWTLTLAGTYYAPAGKTDASYFRVGDAIRLHEWDSDTPTQRNGTITSIAGNDIGVTLTSSWSGTGGNDYVLLWDSANVATASQRERHAFIAGPDMRIDDGADGVPARRFAP
ncbi:hypothetical protein [Sandaracinus amylolyticus]|uniref:hypothetical protein n=1 Tax=Sandaracinus amylolyticus TaxID=927083 RepID=UPI001F218306|nr:hypothetical protein [Sandaracinus amylolyticus]UJR79848.1 Hypothetical protein I5071_18870 [Sandaracinus amylolyticus]